MKRRASKFDAWIDRLANRNLEKGIKPALFIMFLLVMISLSVIYYGLEIEYKVKQNPSEHTSKLPGTIRLLDLLMDSES